MNFKTLFTVLIIYCSQFILGNEMIEVVDTHEYLEDLDTENMLLEGRVLNKKSVILGNSYSRTYYSLPYEVLTAGSSLLGASPITNFSLSMNPWDAIRYNMGSFSLHYVFDLSEKLHLAIRPTYKKTFENNRTKDVYVMEAFGQEIIGGYHFSQNVIFHLNLSYINFINEEQAYEFRRNPLNGDQHQLSINSMLEININNKLGVLTEIGALGVNYEYPLLSTGVSFFYSSKHWYLQIGLSYFGTYDHYFGQKQKTLSHLSVHDQARYDFFIRPEIQLQYFF